MATTDDRYTREDRRRELAIRLIRLEARSSTVARWSGVSRQKIRTLQKSIAAPRGPQSPKRKRGPAPRGTDLFFRTAWVRAEASAAAVLCRLHGALASDATGCLQPVPTVERGERICDAFETYTDLVSPARLTFEHFVLLVDELDSGETVALESCHGCGAALLVEPATLARRRCESCRVTGLHAPLVEEATSAATNPELTPLAQGELF